MPAAAGGSNSRGLQSDAIWIFRVGSGPDVASLRPRIDDVVWPSTSMGNSDKNIYGGPVAFTVVHLRSSQEGICLHFCGVFFCKYTIDGGCEPELGLVVLSYISLVV